MTQTTLGCLTRLVAESADIGRAGNEILPDTPLIDAGLNLDSLALVELIALCEEVFAIEFGEEDLTMEAFTSVRALAEVIDSRKKVVVDRVSA